MKKHLGFFIFFLSIIAIFLWKIILLKDSFLYGDYLMQFYPWLKIYAQSIKNFQFPFWTDLMQNGFPLMAEGQIGGFYPLNILIFFLLPFKIAYNYSIIIHFLIAGLFSYFYARKIGADQWGASLASLLFCFGSSYAGCFYNVATLKTLCWFPTVIYLFELYFDRKKAQFIIFASLIFGTQLLAGSVQMALYSGIFYVFYFSYKAFKSDFKKLSLLKLLMIFLIPAIIIWLPQLKLTLELAKLSGREYATLGFALWKSFNPIGIFSLVFPYSFSVFTSNLYIGVFSLFFVIYAYLKRAGDVNTKNLLLLLLLSLFLGLGQFNPLYIIILKITKFYSFRVPSKFLFFSTFSLAMLAGIGFTKLFEKQNLEQEKKAQQLFQNIILISSFIFITIITILNLFNRQLSNLGHWMVTKFIVNKPYHRHDLDYYLQKSDELLKTLTSSFSIFELPVLISWITVISSFFLYKYFLKKRLRFAVMAFILLDIYIFSTFSMGFRSNIKPFEYLKPQNPAIFNFIKNDSEMSRILPFSLASGKLPLWAMPNANMAYGISNAAAYTPLTNKSYRDKLISLEIVDDSLGVQAPKTDSLIKNLNLIRLLNVKYIISDRKLNFDFLKFSVKDKEIYLYELKDYLPRIFFTLSIERKIVPYPASNLKINSYHPENICLSIDSDQDGFIIFSQNYFPGWKVFVDAREGEIVNLEKIVQAVKISKGIHLILFKYNPY